LVKNKILNIAKWLWLTIVLFGAGYYFVKNHEMVTVLIKNISITRLALSLLFLIIAKLLIAEIARLSVRTEGWNPTYVKMLGIYSITSLAKYLPGGVWHFVGRFSTYRLNDLTNKQTTKAMIVENVWLITSAAAVGGSAYSLFQLESLCKLINITCYGYYPFLVAILIGVIWIMGLMIFNRYFCSQNPSNGFLSAKLILISVLIWALVGISFILLFNTLSLKLVGLSIGGYALSWAVGYIAVFAPGGIGVRETVLATMFSVVAPPEQIAVYAAMNRLIWVIAEILLGLVFLFEHKALLKRKGISGGETDQSDSQGQVMAPANEN